MTSETRDSISFAEVQSAQIVVGTSCVGTGFDKSGVGHLIVVGLPYSIEQLLQWAGRCRLNGNITVLVPSFHLRGAGELAQILLTSATHQQKYERMVSVVDGSLLHETLEIRAPCDNFKDLRNRLDNIVINLAKVSRIAADCCMLCSVIRKARVHHAGGCPSVFNTCFKCLGRHSGKGCSEKFFDVAKRFCFRCWMPLFDIWGVSFHSKIKEDLVTCKHNARDFLKPLSACFFHRRDIVQMECSSIDRSQYQSWLFNHSGEAASGSGQIPNVLLLLEAAFAQMKDVLG